MARLACQAYEFQLGRETTRREGGFLPDFLNFRRTTRVTGWRVGADFKLTHRGCGQNLGLGYAAMPRLSRYSSGLREPREILIRCSLYQRM